MFQHPRRGSGMRSVGRLLAVALSLTVVTTSCADRALSPRSPVSVVGTPARLVGGTVPTMTPTPGPSPTPPVVPTRVQPPPDSLSMPPFFGVGVFAEDTGPVRFMTLAPNGDVFASVPAADRIIVLPDRDGDGVADEVAVFAEGGALNRPHGLAFRSGSLVVANTDGLVRFDYEPGALEAVAEAQSLGFALPGAGQHWTRSLVFDPEGRMYVSVGSSCDVCVESDLRRAAILRLGADGEEATIYASGLRNAVGLSLHPVTGELWATENGRDQLGDNLPPDEINRIVAGGNYGWPHCYGEGVLDPTLGADAADCVGTIGPAVALPAHSAPLGLTFYTGTMFPEEYWGDLFVAYHGSMNRSLPTGYKVVRVPFTAGRPDGGPEDFVWGWLRRDTRRWGRPVDLVVAPDGALLVSDDAGGRVYRMYYARPKPTPTAWSR